LSNHVLVADTWHVMALDVVTGTSFAYALPGARKSVSALPAAPDVTHTLTAADQSIYVRLGSNDLGPPKDDPKGKKANSQLVCLHLQAAEQRFTERWTIPPPAGADFEGAPVIRDGRLWVAATRTVGDRAQTMILCHDAPTGRLRWQQGVCDTH